MFDINDSRDFYTKLLADFDDFMAEPDSGRLALNCAITAYHMADWVWADWLKSDAATKAKLNVKTKEDFLAYLDRAWPWFPTVQALCNGTKHFGRKEDFDAVRVQGYGMGAFGSGGYGVSYLTIDYGENGSVEPDPHRFMDVVLMLEGTVRLWRDFLSAYGPYIGALPVGTTALSK
ncbi:MAG TPA: hypothetical protein VNR39_11735 [Pseudolabrys sp.]|nr:hypothetical protein [Pseudolabrys sp.]